MPGSHVLRLASVATKSRCPQEISVPASLSSALCRCGQHERCRSSRLLGMAGRARKWMTVRQRFAAFLPARRKIS
jgi:hypothetical protein